MTEERDWQADLEMCASHKHLGEIYNSVLPYWLERCKELEVASMIALEEHCKSLHACHAEIAKLRGALVDKLSIILHLEYLIDGASTGVDGKKRFERLYIGVQKEYKEIAIKQLIAGGLLPGGYEG